MFSVILAHLAKYRPHWTVDIQAATGMECVLTGLCNRVWSRDELVRESDYDSVADLSLVESFVPFADKPSSKVTKMLTEVFNLPYDAAIGRYAVYISSKAQNVADRYLRARAQQDGHKYRAVAIHHRGASSPHRKNLSDWQAEEIARMVKESGRTPILMNDLPFGKDGWDASAYAGLIHKCEAFVGVDSGPAKLASATETPSLVCWVQNHPAQYHDPAPNTEHLIPLRWREMEKLAGNEQVYSYFRDHYRFRTYCGDHGLVAQACFWLAETLRVGVEVASIKFVVPDGLQAASWCVRKMPGIAQGRPIDVFVSGDPKHPSDTILFYHSFNWCRSAQMTALPVHTGPEKPRNTRGHYLYVSEGVRDGYYYLIPLTHIETGRTIEEWLPDVPTIHAIEETLSPSQENLNGGCAAEGRSQG